MRGDLIAVHPNKGMVKRLRITATDTFFMLRSLCLRVFPYSSGEKIALSALN